MTDSIPDAVKIAEYDRLIAENISLKQRLSNQADLLDNGLSWSERIFSALAYLWTNHKTDISLFVATVAIPFLVHFFAPAATVPQVDPVVVQKLVDEAIAARPKVTIVREVPQAGYVK